MRLPTFVLIILILAGLALRLFYLTSSHPFFDEYTTVLAARQILRFGWPLLPSGLFYEHGLLATYLAAPFTALFINQPLTEWQPAQWGLMLARWPSLLVSVATIPLIFAAARRLLAPAGPQLAGAVGLLAAGLFALSPEGMVWGGRARMYALATFLVLLTVLWAYRGALFPAPARYRWLSLAALLATLLTQFGALMLVPPLVVAMLVVGHTSQRAAHQPSTRVWFLRPAVLLEGAALAAIIGLSIWVKRLGQPLGAPALAEADGDLFSELAGTITYQTAFYFSWPETEKFLARQFGVPHHLWLALLAVAGLLLALVVFARRQKSIALPLLPGGVFVWLVFGLLVVQMVSLLEPFRRNPRYMVMVLPLFYLLAAATVIFLLRQAGSLLGRRANLAAHPLAALALAALFAAAGWRDVRVALATPEPAYEQAFARIAAEWQPGDTLLTMNAPAAELYLGRLDGFTVQNDADQFLLNAGAAPIDRWVGAPWLGSAAQFNAALNASPRVWYVTDTIRQPVYFRGDWQAVVNTQLEPVWAGDNALLYRTAPNRMPLPASPAARLNANFDNAIQLLGVTLNKSQLATRHSPLAIVLFWQPQIPIHVDYTVFLHLRNAAGQTVAQRDSQPLDGAYPTSQWQSGETVIDPLTLPLPPDLPPGPYRLVAGLYRLDTGQRLPVANDTSGENAVDLGEVTLP